MPHAPDAKVIIDYVRLQAAAERLAGVASALATAARGGMDAMEKLEDPPAVYPWSQLGPICDAVCADAMAVEGMVPAIMALHDKTIKTIRDLAYAALEKAGGS